VNVDHDDLTFVVRCSRNILNCESMQSLKAEVILFQEISSRYPNGESDGLAGGEVDVYMHNLCVVFTAVKVLRIWSTERIFYRVDLLTTRSGCRDCEVDESESKS